MMTLEEKFKELDTENAPGQEGRQIVDHLDAIMWGEKLEGTPVDFSHGDVGAFLPTPASFEAWNAGHEKV